MPFAGIQSANQILGDIYRRRRSFFSCLSQTQNGSQKLFWGKLRRSVSALLHLPLSFRCLVAAGIFADVKIRRIVSQQLV